MEGKIYTEYHVVPGKYVYHLALKKSDIFKMMNFATSTRRQHRSAVRIGAACVGSCT